MSLAVTAVTISVHNCSAGTQNVSGSQSTGKHSLNGTVFSSWRKATKVGAFLTRVGKEFQALAAAAGKARSPSVERCVDGTSSVDVSADRRWRVARLEAGWMSQQGSSVLIREDNTHNRNWMRSGTLSQWSSRKSDRECRILLICRNVTKHARTVAITWARMVTSASTKTPRFRTTATFSTATLSTVHSCYTRRLLQSHIIHCRQSSVVVAVVLDSRSAGNLFSAGRPIRESTCFRSSDACCCHFIQPHYSWLSWVVWTLTTTQPPAVTVISFFPMALRHIFTRL